MQDMHVEKPGWVPCEEAAPNQQDDTHLMRGIQAGDEDALAALYDRYAGLLYTLCRNYSSGFNSRGPGPSAARRSPGFLNGQSESERQPQPMH